ncbi:hypothetical protein I7I48_10408 [Histoplasma ohiense]|nr:hypothetical protein I7I48_10408 [Histoplasma ohiense (nom. inval.)]
MMSFRGSAVEELTEERLMKEELAEKSMKKIVEASVTAAVSVVSAFFVNLPLTSVEQGERVPQMVEKWEKKMRENIFLHQIC